MRGVATGSSPAARQNCARFQGEYCEPLDITSCIKDLRARADCERWMDWQQTALATPMGVAFRALLREPREAMPEEQLHAAVKRAGELWRMLDARLADRAYVGGDALTMGDIALGNAIHRWYKLPVDRPQLLHLKAWYERCCKRPAYSQHIASV